MNQTVKSKWPKVYFSIVFLYFFILRFLVIPSGDDFFWGGEQGNYLLHHGFYGPQSIYGGSSNGRYIGNFLEIFTVHHLLPAMLMYGTFWTLLLYCMWKLSGQTKLSLLLSSLFVFTFQDGYISTVLSWNAGFINYVPPISLMLLYLVVLKEYFADNLQTNKYFLTAGTFLMSLVGGLFVEHLTLYQIFIGVVAIVAGKFIFKKAVTLYQSGYLLGAVVSAAIMFSHPAYHEHSTYRNTNFDLHAIISNYFSITHFWFNTLNIFVNIAICLAIIVLSSNLIRNDFRRRMTSLVAAFFVIYYLIMNIWLSQQSYDEFFMYKQISSKLPMIDGFMTIVFWLFLIYATISFFKPKQDYLTYFSMFTYFALISPFILIVSPINSREFFTAYIFLYLGAIMFITKALSFYSFKARKNVKILAAVVLLVAALNVGTKMTINYQANIERVQDEQFLAGKTALKKHVPYRKYVLSNDALLQQSAPYWQEFLSKNWIQRLY